MAGKAGGREAERHAGIQGNPTMIRFVFFGHHKVASSWLHRLFWNILTDAGIPYRVFNRLDQPERELITDLLETEAGPMGFGISNAKAEDPALFAGFAGIHVIRDPREMVVSGYYSHRDSHPLFPGLAAERARLREVGFGDGLRVIMDGIMKETFESMREWPEPGDCRFETVKFEDMCADYDILWDALSASGLTCAKEGPLTWPGTTWNQAAARLGSRRAMVRGRGITRASFDLHLKRLLDNRQRKQRRFRREGRIGHHRTGKKKGWRESFGPEERAHFEKRFPGLVERLGYPSWEPGSGTISTLDSR